VFNRVYNLLDYNAVCRSYKFFLKMVVERFLNRRSYFVRFNRGIKSENANMSNLIVRETLWLNNLRFPTKRYST